MPQSETSPPPGEGDLLGYSREEFERQYNARLLVPDHDAISTENLRRSEAFRAEARCVLDVPYGPGEKETLDLFLPATTGPAPVHLFIHGGFWRSRDKAAFSFLARPLVEAGALVAITNYALCPAVGIETIVAQMRAAALWLWHRAAEHGGDPTRLHVSGHSAGGHLAAMLIATDWSAEDRKVPPDLIKSAVPVSGLYDLEPLLAHSVNDDLRLTPEMARGLSPVGMEPRTPAPVAIYVGAAESDEFRRQSRLLAEAWDPYSPALSLRELPGHDHFTILRDLADPDYVVQRRIRALMGLG